MYSCERRAPSLSELSASSVSFELEADARSSLLEKAPSSALAAQKFNLK
jgi:hypothetical protein